MKRVLLAASIALLAMTATAGARPLAVPTKQAGKLIVGFDVPAPGFWNGHATGTTIRNPTGFEAALSQAGHGRRRGSHARKDDGPCLGQILRRRGDRAAGVEARESVLHAAQVAGPVVDQRDHFVLGLRPRSAGSSAHAWRRACARALKVASAR